MTPNSEALDDYMKGLRRFYNIADYIAVNVSSPNTSGLRELQFRICEETYFPANERERSQSSIENCSYCSKA